MKILKLLFEAKQVGKLYHYTSPDNWKLIKRCNCLRSRGMVDMDSVYTPNKYRKTQSPNLPHISFTRNPNLHKTPYFDELKFLGGTEYPSIRLTLDGTLLSNNYKIEPYRYYYDMPKPEYLDEFEERIFTQVIRNLDKYLLQVDNISSTPTSSNTPEPSIEDGDLVIYNSQEYEVVDVSGNQVSILRFDPDTGDFENFSVPMNKVKKLEK